MAMLYIGQNAGQQTENPEIPVAGSSTQSTDVELRIDLTKSWNSVELRRAVEALGKIAYSHHEPTAQGLIAAEAFCALDPWSRDLV